MNALGRQTLDQSAAAPKNSPIPLNRNVAALRSEERRTFGETSSSRARIYTTVVSMIGAALLAIYFPRSIESPPLFAALLIVGAIASLAKLQVPTLLGSSGPPAVTYAVDFTALLLIGPAPAMLIAAARAYCQGAYANKEREPENGLLFNMATSIVAVLAAGAAYRWLGGAGLAGANGGLVIRPLAGAAATYFAVSTVSTATAIALATRQPIDRVWAESAPRTAPTHVVGAVLAGLTVWITAAFPERWLVLLAVVPLFLAYKAYTVYLRRVEEGERRAGELADLHLATIEALALAIDAKDQTSQAHIRRVQLYASSMARMMGLSDNDVQGVKTAALLHDIGKLAVPEHILFKPGTLTADEFQKLRAHPQVGADIVSSVPFPYPVAPLILSHHERWDGKGYPSGLKGAEIPLGARILAVADYFDESTTERPQHEALSYDAAVAQLRTASGKALDPQVVAAFLEALPALRAQAAAIDRTERGVPHRATADSVTSIRLQTPSKVLEDIALANQEIYALYDIAQAMGTSLGVADTMSLISAKLSSLVPYSCVALFLYDEESQILRCRFAAGVDADIIQRLEVASGKGVIGWVARNRRPLANASPTTDFGAAGMLESGSSLKSAVICPLIFNTRLIGTLAVYHVEPAFFREDHRRLLDRVSEQAAAVINNSILFDQTQADSLTDTLTGLPNTRHLFTHLTGELARAQRLSTEVALLIMDLDSFKEINDTYGHHVGDRALCDVARVLRAAIRPYDICVRYAGDEFIIVLSGCSLEEAELKRVELQKEVAEVAFEARPGLLLPLGISVGIAIFSRDGDSYETLLATADSRMYQDKAGRKRAAGPRDTAVMLNGKG